MDDQDQTGDAIIPGTCQICKGVAVTQVPIRSLKPQTVRRYIFDQTDAGRDVALCGVCTMLHCDDTFEGDGPERFSSGPGPLNPGSLSRPGRTSAGCVGRSEDEDIPQCVPSGGSHDYACALLRMLERSGYHIYLRSDGRQLILSHEDGLDRQTRGQVERYRREITEVIIDRLWKGGSGA